MNVKLLTFVCLFNLVVAGAFSQNKLAHWGPVSTASTTFPLAAADKAAMVSSATVNYGNGLKVNSYEDSRNIWISTNEETSVDPATTPYVSYSINSLSSIKFDRFVFGSIAVWNASIKLQLRWSVDGYATSLGEFKHNGGSWTLTSVNLSSLAAAPAGEVTFRVYFYNAPTSVFLGADSEVYPTLDGTPASYGGKYYSTSIWYASVATDLPSVTVDDFLVYPNPAKDVLNINTQENVVITDISGRVCYQGVVKDNRIDIHHLPAGIYVVSLNGSQGTISKRFIKK